MDIEYATALESGGDYDADELRAALTGRAPYSLADTEDPANLTALVDGRIPLSIIWNQILFHLDPDDTTTAADNVTVIKTADNYVYKVEFPDYRTRAALSDTTTAPPGSPGVGDIYLVPAGATGAWSSHQDDIAIYTRNGWRFETPGIGKWLLIEDTDGFKRYTALGWVYGPGARSFSASSVPFSAAISFGQFFVVENQTTNTPPTATLGLAYIVGSSPTGAWSGKALKIAICEVAGTWTFYTPTNGFGAYDKSLNSAFSFNGTSWASSQGANLDFWETAQTASGSTSGAGSGSYSYSSGTAPTTTNTYTTDDVGLTFTARRSGQRIVFEYSANVILTSGSGRFTAALFRDSETTAIDWVGMETSVNGIWGGTIRFQMSAGDTSSHTFKVKLLPNSTAVSAITRRYLTARGGA